MYKTTVFYLMLPLLFYILPCNAQQTISFNTLYEGCLKNNISLRKKQIETQISNTAFLSVKYPFLPKIQGNILNGAYQGRFADPFTNLFSIGNLYTNSMSINSSMTLYNGGKNIYQKRIFSANRQISIFEEEAIKNELKKDLLKQFIMCAMYVELEILLQKQIEHTKEEITVTQELIKSEVFTESKILEFISLQTSEEAQLEEIKNAKKIAALRLSMISGIKLNDNDKLDIGAFSPDTSFSETDSIMSEFDDVLENNYEYRIAESNLSIADQEIKKSISNFLPRIELNAAVYTGYSSRRYDYSNPNNIVVVPFPNQLNQNLNQSLSLSMIIPIFSGFENKYDYQSSVLQRKAAELDKESIENEKRELFTEMVFNCSLHQKNYSAALKKQQECDILFNENTDKFTNGRLKLTDYFISRQNFYVAKIDVVRKKYTYILNYNMLNIERNKELIFN